MALITDMTLPTAAAPAPADLEPSLRAHNASFLSLLALIPPQFYLSPLDTDDDIDQGINTKFMKNTKKERKAATAAAAAAAVAAAKEEKKEKKRRKLDPEVVAKTVLDVQKERREAEKHKLADASGDISAIDIDGMDEDEDSEVEEDEDDSDSDAEEDSDLNLLPKSAHAKQIDNTTPVQPRPFGNGSFAAQSEPKTHSDSISSLRERLANKIAALQSRRGGLGASGANAIAIGSSGGDGPSRRGAGADDDSLADEEDGDSSMMSADADGSIASTRDELLEERRRKRGEMRDKRRRERKELRRQATAQAAAAAASSSSSKGNQAKNGAPTPTTKGCKAAAAPGLLVPEGKGSRFGSSSEGLSGVDGGDVTFSTLQFAGDNDAGKKKKDRNALPSDPKQALEVLQARKRKEAERKAARGEDSEGEEGRPSSSKTTLNGVESADDSVAWSKALSAAKGVKIRDDEKLLRKAAKRKEKLKTKSGVEWSERKKDVEKKQADVQQRRQENLTQRIEAKKAKKMGKKLPSSTADKKRKSGGAPGGGKRTKDRKLGSGSASRSGGKPAGRAGGGRAGFEGKKFGGGGGGGGGGKKSTR